MPEPTTAPLIGASDDDPDEQEVTSWAQLADELDANAAYAARRFAEVRDAPDRLVATLRTGRDVSGWLTLFEAYSTVAARIRYLIPRLTAAIEGGQTDG